MPLSPHAKVHYSIVPAIWPKLQKFCVKRALKWWIKKQGVTWVKGLWMPTFMDKVRWGALAQVTCETDFVARTPQFRDFVHEVAL